MAKKKLTKTQVKSLHKNLQDKACPNCTATDLHSPDGENINCKNCEGSWTPDAFVQVYQEAKR